MIAGSLDHWRQAVDRVSGHGLDAWRIAFEALCALDADSPEGETRLQGDEIILRVMGYPTRAYGQETVLESHRRYIDIQTALRGGERIAWFPVAALAPAGEYDAERDVQFYQTPPAPGVTIDVRPGSFCVLYPGDGHMPQLKLGDAPEQILKAVVKLDHRLVAAPETLEADR